MRRLALLAVAATLAAQPAFAETFAVRLDQSARIRLSAPARDVIVGNPGIADVSMIDSRNVVVLGKAYGMTNLIVVDRAGRTILERDLVVTAPEASVSIFRGPQMVSYACSSLCERVGPPAAASTPATSDPAAAAPAP
ncbi:MAG: pilus assembly protein N-terminal domain-containing protein [Phenylobacterium sp.]|uniref:pilus assembly protein N-terminal domain-containing protein n=1 Tax=Phenylobacterium sp. TaxID=1871053 RepID=UPI002732C31A|nr:pilus assembly protein N-terminal domain-containing protein [Phenylobacterium sp.]MDP3175277.1 pilus assembly protein N-terminal domain-containing protein [Phenylobacterium sp.]